MRSMSRALVGVVAAALVAAGCTGCSGGGDDGRDHQVRLKSFSVEIGEPADIIPGDVGEIEGGTVVRLLFRGLTEFDPETGRAVNVGARSIQSSDRRNWTVTLADGWTFSNGEKVTAQDYVDSWNAVLQNGWGNAYFFTDLLRIKGASDVPKKTRTMAGLRAVDDKTIKISLDAPNTNLPLILGYSAFVPMPASVLRSKDWKSYKARPIGNGPYMMDGTWQHNKLIKVKRNPRYSGPDKAWTDTISLKIYGSFDAAYDDAVAGNLDISRVPSSRLAVAAEDFGDRYLQAPSSSFDFYGFPLWQEEFKDVRIRQAISMAIDRNAINERLLDDTVVPAKGLVTPLLKLGHRDDPCGAACTYDPVRARQLYEAAGGIPGDHTTFWFSSGSGHDEYVRAIARQLKANLGLSVSLRQQPWSQYTATVDDHGVTGPYLLGWSMDYPSPENYLGPVYGTKGSANGTGYSNPRVDRLLARGNAAATPQDAIGYYHEAEDLVLKDLPVLPLWFGKSQLVHSERVTNFQWDSMGYLMLDRIQVTR
jgi:oligopeptide transport system substrate-binding protein